MKKTLIALASCMALSIVCAEARTQAKSKKEVSSKRTCPRPPKPRHDCKICKGKAFKGCFSYRFNGPFGPPGSFANETTSDILELGIFYTDGEGNLLALGDHVITGSSDDASPGSVRNSTLWDCTWTITPSCVILIDCDLYLNGANPQDNSPSFKNIKWTMNLVGDGDEVQFVYLSDSARAADLFSEGSIQGRGVKLER